MIRKLFGVLGFLLIVGFLAAESVRAEGEVVVEVGETSAVVESSDETSLNNNSVEMAVGESTVAEIPVLLTGEENQSVGESSVVEIPVTISEINNSVGESTVTETPVVVSEENNSVGESVVVIEDNAEHKIESGDAVAYADVINQINTNVVGSEVAIYLVNDFNGEWANLDINGMWKKLGEGKGVVTIKSGSEGDEILIISNWNAAVINNQVVVVANSGNNEVRGGGEVLIVSGKATAIANVINLVNSNIVGSQLFIGIINVAGEELGDIVLPNPESFKNSDTNNSSSGTVNSSNQVEVNNEVKVEAKSGDNSENQVDLALIESGEAQSLANEVTVANLNVEASDQLWLQVNLLGGGEGKVYNWSYPGSVEEFSGDTLFFILNGENCLECGGGSVLVSTQNQAEINNRILVEANSGGNQIEEAGSGEIRSGTARAVANLSNLINLNIQGSNWFWGIINVIGKWKGDIVFAYPDLAVSLSADRDKGRSGEEVLYRVDYGNLGDEGIEEAELEIELPAEMSYVDDDSGSEALQEGNKLKWKITNLLAKSGDSFYLKLRLGDSQERRETELRVAALISSGKIESNLDNNRSSWATIIWYPSDEGSKSEGGKIEVEAKNNVNDYVLPGDTVTFQIKVKNSGEKKIKEAVLVHEIFDEKGNLWSSNQIYLGDIELNKEGLINFGIVMAEAGGKYYSQTWIKGKDEKDNEIYSNIAETSFEVKRKVVLLKKGEVLAAEAETEAVTGGVCLADKNFWPYLMLFIVSSLWLQRQLKIWLERK